MAMISPSLSPPSSGGTVVGAGARVVVVVVTVVVAFGSSVSVSFSRISIVVSTPIDAGVFVCSVTTPDDTVVVVGGGVGDAAVVVVASATGVDAELDVVIVDGGVSDVLVPVVNVVDESVADALVVSVVGDAVVVVADEVVVDAVVIADVVVAVVAVVVVVSAGAVVVDTLVVDDVDIAAVVVVVVSVLDSAVVSVLLPWQLARPARHASVNNNTSNVVVIGCCWKTFGCLRPDVRPPSVAIEVTAALGQRQEEDHGDDDGAVFEDIVRTRHSLADQTGDVYYYWTTLNSYRTVQRFELCSTTTFVRRLVYKS
jgi:hypothetical protein